MDEPLHQNYYSENQQAGIHSRNFIIYAIKKEKEIFDVPGLEQVTMSLPAEYELKMLGAAEFELCQKNAWAHDLISQYKDYDT